MSLRDATANSVNTVYAQLGIDVGPENFDRHGAQARASPRRSQGVYAEALGGTAECCTVLEMSNAYATIANGGVHHDPTAINKVVFPDGEVDEPDLSEGTRAVTDGVAYTVADVMTGTLDYGTAACCDIPCPAAGKTGTTELQSDAWFVGYTPHISTAVWTGNPDMRVPLPGYGADLSAPIWHDFMIEAIGEQLRRLPGAGEPGLALGLLLRPDGRPRTTTRPTHDTYDTYDTDRRRRRHRRHRLRRRPDVARSPTPAATRTTTPTSTRPAPARSRRPRPTPGAASARVRRWDGRAP